MSRLFIMRPVATTLIMVAVILAGWIAFQFLPLIMMFTMGRFSAGLVIYWTWNNLLTIGQQWYIQNGVTLTKKKA